MKAKYSVKYKKKKNRGKRKRNPNTIYLVLKEAYTETRLDEYLRTGIPSQMTFTNFLVMHMNYPYEEATEITECYRKWEHRFEK